MTTIKRRTPRGIRNNNPLNLRVGNNWKGEVEYPSDPTFEQFTEMKWGVRAAFVVLRNYIVRRKCNTIRDIISRWAPSNENDTERYIRQVAYLSRIDVGHKIIWDYFDMKRLFDAMCFVENGMYIEDSVVEEGWMLANK